MTTMLQTAPTRLTVDMFMKEPVLAQMPVRTALDVHGTLGNELFAKMARMLGLTQVQDWPDDVAEANRRARMQPLHKRYDAEGNVRSLTLFAEESSPVQVPGAWFCFNRCAFLKMFRTPVGWQVTMSPDVALDKGHLKEAEALELFHAYQQVFGR